MILYLDAIHFSQTGDKGLRAFVYPHERVTGKIYFQISPLSEGSQVAHLLSVTEARRLAASLLDAANAVTIRTVTVTDSNGREHNFTNPLLVTDTILGGGDQ